MTCAEERAAFAVVKVWLRGSDHLILSAEVCPATASSNGKSRWMQSLMTWASTLYAPMNECRPFTVAGGSQWDMVAIQQELAFRVPYCHIQPSMVVVHGAIVVLCAKRWRSDLCRALRTYRQLCRSSAGDSPTQNKSSASFTTIPSVRRSPRTRHINSSNVVSEPGMPWQIEHRLGHL